MASSASQVLLWLLSEQNLSPIGISCIVFYKSIHKARKTRKPTFTAKSKQIRCFCQVLANFGLWPFAIAGSVSHGIFCFAGSALVAIGAEPKSNQNKLHCILQNHSQSREDPHSQLSPSKFGVSCRFWQILGSGPLLFQALFPMASSASQVLLWLPSEQNLSPIRMRCIVFYKTIHKARKTRKPTFTAKSKQIRCFLQVLANFGLWPFAIPGSVSHGIFCFAGSALVAIGADPKSNQNEMYCILQNHSQS